MAVFATTVQRTSVNDEADMYRLRSVVGDKHVAIRENITSLPVDNFIKETGGEISVGLVSRHIVKLYSKHVPVVKHDKPPAIRSVKTARSISPWLALYPLEKLIFKHFATRGTLRCYRGGQHYYSAGFSASVCTSHHRRPLIHPTRTASTV